MLKDSRFFNISTLIIKVTNRCNLDCLYCYENVSRLGVDMSIETYKCLVDKTLSNTTQSSINFLFHGGEPSLISNQWYEQAMEYTIQMGKKYLKKVVFSMQTNLLALPDAKIDLFKKYDVQLGISLDGTFEENTAQRGAELRVLQNYNKLVNNNLKVGILSTINVDNFDKFDKICLFFESIKIKSFKANTVYNVGRGLNNQVLETSHVVQAQTSILKHMLNTKGLGLIEQNTLLELKRFFGQKTASSLCHDQVCGAGKLAMGITTNGDILPCGRFQWNDSQYYLGHIAAKEEDYFNKLNNFQNEAPENWLNCKNCGASKICRFSCQAFIVRSKDKINQECKPTIEKFNFFVEHHEALKLILANVEKGQRANVLFTIKTPQGPKEYHFNQ